MADEHSHHEEGEAPSSDSSLQRRPGNPRGSDSRSDGERGKGLAANRAGSPGGDGLSEQDDVLEAQVLDRVDQLLSVTRIAPLPEPSELQAYETIEKGLANRIVMMAENSADAANAATKSNAAVNNALAGSILEEGRSVKRGQWMFFALAVGFLVTAIILEFLDRTPFATGMGILGFLSVVGVLVRPKNGSRWKPINRGEEDSSADK